MRDVKEMRGAECRRNQPMVERRSLQERKARQSNATGFERKRGFKASRIQRAAERSGGDVNLALLLSRHQAPELVNVD